MRGLVDCSLERRIDQLLLWLELLKKKSERPSNDICHVERRGSFIWHNSPLTEASAFLSQHLRYEVLELGNGAASELAFYTSSAGNRPSAEEQGRGGYMVLGILKSSDR